MMQNLINYFKQLPKLIKGTQIFFVATILLYILMIMGGGSFTTYYAAMLMSISGLLAGLVSLIKKQWVLGIINLVAIAILFVTYIYIIA